MQRYRLVTIHEEGSLEWEDFDKKPSFDECAERVAAHNGHTRIVFLRGLTEIPMWREDLDPNWFDVPMNHPVNAMIDRELQKNTYVRGRLVMLLDRQGGTWDIGQTFIRGVLGWAAFYRLEGSEPDEEPQEDPDWMKGMTEDEYDSWAAGMSAWAKSLRREQE